MESNMFHFLNLLKELNDAGMEKLVLKYTAVTGTVEDFLIYKFLKRHIQSYTVSFLHYTDMPMTLV
jgi:hypothetical protein